MLEECLTVFKKELQDKSENLIFDSIILEDGDYVLVQPDGKYTVERVKYDKKTDSLVEKPENYSKLCFYDYYSRLIDMNKPQDPKKIIQSNNYLSFFVKKESFTNGKMNQEAISRYFEVLKDPSKKYKGKDLELYTFISTRLDEIDLDKLERNKMWLMEHVFDLEEVYYDQKEYLKIFFIDEDAAFINEGKRYMQTKIFNSNAYNVFQDDTVYGVPNDNLQLNEKKPFLKNRSRYQVAPNMISLEQALLQKKFFDFLMNQANRRYTNIFIDTSTDSKYPRIVAKKDMQIADATFSGIYLKIKKGKVLEIQYSDTIAKYKPYLNKPFHYNNVLRGKADDIYGFYSKVYEMESIIDNIIFSKYLKNNYFTPAEELKSIDNIYRRSIVGTRNAIFAWLYTGYQGDIANTLMNVTMEGITHSINNGYFVKVQKQLNLWFALDTYFNEKENVMDTIIDTLRTKINAKEACFIENDLEYSFAVGQAISYLEGLSKAKDKNLHYMNQFIGAQNDTVLKERIAQTISKYSYALPQKMTRINKLLAMVLGYTKIEKIDKAMLIAGCVGFSLLYEKGEKSDDE